MHENQNEVKELKKMDGKQRKRAIELLRLRGNHQQNLKVLRKKYGQIRILRRKDNVENESECSETKFFDIQEYGPCPCCLGWILKKNLKRHTNTCKAKDEVLNNSISFLEVQSDIISGRITENACKMLVEEVFTIMKNDKIKKIAKKDELIINLGNQWIKRNIGNKVMRKYYTSSVMRLAARLLTELQKLSGNEPSMTLIEFLRPAQFENVVTAALKVSRQDDDDIEDIKAPSNAIKLGYDVKRLASAKYALGITTGNTIMKKEGKEFLTLMSIRWHTEVTQLAREVLLKKSLNKVFALPLPEDVQQLTNHMKAELSNFDVTDKSYSNFRRGATLALARLTLFNRRCHEVQGTRLENFEKRKIGVDAVSVEMMRKLTDWEKKLLETQELMKVRGKQTKPVPVIILGDVVKVLVFLGDHDVRKEATIQVCNKFLFASNGMGVVRAYDAIKKLTEEAHLQMPNLIRTTKMRKYMATMVQCLDTTEAERQWIIIHLGHTMDVHLTHYRQVSDILERVDVAKILLIQDTNQVSKCVGRKPREVDLEEIVSVDSQQEDKEVHEEDGCEREDPIPDIFDFCKPFEKNDEPSCTTKKAKPVVRQKWTPEEEAELRVLFATNFSKLKCPNTREIQSAMKNSLKRKGMIHKRKLDNIKKKVSNMLIKIRQQN